MTKRSCEIDPVKTRTGKPCGANPLKPGTVIEGVTVTGRYCRKHDPDLPITADLRGPHAGAGRPKKPTASEIERRLVEEHAIAWQRPYWRVLGYDLKMGEHGPELVEREEGGAKLFGESKDGHINVSPHDDLGAMIAAAEKLRDRVFGRPKQSSEVTVITQDAIDVAIERMERELAERDGDSGDPGVDRALQATEGGASG